ncbi:SDR family NAD(P)-dependent oxidoreductase [Actinomycetota bacterium]
MSEGIAIVGMGCEYPDASTPEQLWHNVLEQRRSFRRIPSSRLGADYHSQSTSPIDSTYSQTASVLADYEFDRVAHSVNASTYRSTDLTQWLALDVAGRAIADATAAAVNEADNARVGVIVGNTLGGEFMRAQTLRLRWPYVARVLNRVCSQEGLGDETTGKVLAEAEKLYKSSYPEPTADTLAGSLPNVIAGRICNYFDFHGGAFTVDAACASSLLAVIQGAQALLRHDLDVAVVGGVDLSLDPFELNGFSRASALTKSVMRVYDDRSSGFWPGEGCGFVVLVRESDLTAQERVYATLRGWGISSDGRGGTTRPERDGQAIALQRAYSHAGWEASDVVLYEGHGTGTPVGDEVEISTIAQMRGDTDVPAFIGSIKANIGHTKAAAGVAGLIKAAMAVNAGVIPPMTGCTTPRRELATRESGLHATTQPLPWPDRPRRAAVSAMGFGGVNTHLLLDAPPNSGPRRSQTNVLGLGASSTPQDVEVLHLSAASREELLAAVDDLTERTRHASLAELRDLAVAQQRAPEQGPFRVAVLVEAPTDAADKLAAAAEALRAGALDGTDRSSIDPDQGIFLGRHIEAAPIGFIFPGQAAPPRRDLGLLGRRFPHLTGAYPLPPLETTDGITDTSIAQPSIVSASLAGAAALDAVGIRPTLCIGHSLGEIPALAVAGALSEPDAMTLAAARGHLMSSRCQERGGMVEVRAPRRTVEELAQGLGLDVAAVNGPDRVVLSGAMSAVEAAASRAAARGVKAIPLRVSHAFHSSLMAPARDPLRDELDKVDVGTPNTCVVSTVTGKDVTAEDDTRALLVDQLQAPVLYSDALRHASPRVEMLLEVGPGHVFGDLAAGQVPASVLSLDVGTPSARSFLAATAAGYALGHPIVWTAVQHGREQRLADPLAPHNFLANPCEAVAFEGGRSGRALGEQPEGIPAEEPHPAPVPTAQFGRPPAPDDERAELTVPKTEARPGADTPASALDVVLDVVSQRTELPAEQVRLDARLLDDFGLNSLAVAELAAEAASTLGVQTALAPGDLVRMTVGDLAELLEAAEASSGEIVPGVESWVRAFDTTWERCELNPPLSLTSWAVKACAGASPVAAQLALDTFAPTHATSQRGLVVVAPAGITPTDAVEYLTALRAALDPGVDRLVVLHTGNAAAAAKCLVHERGNLTVTAIAIDPDAASGVSPELLLGLADSTTRFRELRILPSGQVEAATLQVATTEREDPSESTVSEADTVLFLGGGHGIAAECAAGLAEAAGCRVVLTGRSDPSTPAVTETMRRLEAGGHRFEYHQVDLTDPVATRALVADLEQRHGAVDGVVHATGHNSPASLANLETGEIATTIAAKLAPLTNTANALSQAPKVWISFGSVIARIGMHGEAHYALANDWLALTTSQLQDRWAQTRLATVDWSVWSGAGMGERLGTVEALARQGVSPITVSAGTSEFLELLARGRGRPCVASRFGRPPTLPDPLRSMPLLRFLENASVFTPGVELITEATLAIDTDPYLQDHALDGVGVFPAVAGLEAMAQVYTALVGRAPEAASGVRFAAPITVSDGQPTTIRVAALVTDRRTAEVRFAVRTDQTGFSVDHFTATMSCRPTDSPDQASTQKTRPVAVATPAEMYETLLFHGPRFQTVDRLAGVHADHVQGHLTASPTDDWFHHYLPAQLVLGSMGLRDGALHCAQASIPQSRFLPVSVDRIDFIGVADSHPDRWVQIVQTAHVGESLTVDLTVTDDAGTPVEQWVGLTYAVTGATATPSHWSDQLAGACIERQLEAQAGTLLPVHIGVGVGPAARAQALERAGVNHHDLTKRVDGHPLVASDPELHVTLSHAGSTCVAASSRSRCVGVDIEPVDSELRNWPQVLSARHYALAQELQPALDRDLQTAGLLVWTISEAVFKAGVPWDTPLTLTHVDPTRITVQAGDDHVHASLLSLESGEHAIAVAVRASAAAHPRTNDSDNDEGTEDRQPTDAGHRSVATGELATVGES